MLFAWGYHRGRFLPAVLTVLSPVTVIVVVWFLGFSNAAPRAWGNGAPVADTPPVRGSTPVVMVVFDEFSSLELLDERGRIDGARFPTFARPRARGDVVPQRDDRGRRDDRGSAAILTGRLDVGKQPVEEDHPRNLFLLLGDQYELNVEEPLTHLCTSCDGRGWGAQTRHVVSSFWDLTKQRLRRGDPADFLGIPYRTIDKRAAAFRKWGASVRGGRTLNFLHIQFPHTPWWYTPDGRQYTTRVLIPELTNETWTQDQRAVDGYRRRYVDQVRFVDRLVGELRRTLIRKGIWDDALVVLVADHGVAFVPGASRRFVSLANYAEVASVPLFVKAPRQRRGRTSDELARTTDVLPTIGDHLGVRWPTQGRSLREPVRRSDVSVSTIDRKPAVVARKAYLLLRDRAAMRLQEAVPSR